MNQLKQDVLQAYDELGGVDYLLTQPELLKRILVKLVKQPEAPPTTIVIDFSKEVPWLDRTKRLAYRYNTPLIAEVPSAERIEQSTLLLGLDSSDPPH